MGGASGRCRARIKSRRLVVCDAAIMWPPMYVLPTVHYTPSQQHIATATAAMCQQHQQHANSMRRFDNVVHGVWVLIQVRGDRADNTTTTAVTLCACANPLPGPPCAQTAPPGCHCRVSAPPSLMHTHTPTRTQSHTHTPGLPYTQTAPPAHQGPVSEIMWRTAPSYLQPPQSTPAT